MRRRWRLHTATWVLVATLGAAAAAAAAETGASDSGAEDLVRRTVAALPKQPFRAKLELTPSGAPTREIDLRHKRIGTKRASYLEVTAPEELKGIRFLFIEEEGAPPEQYIKIATAKNPVRVKDQIRTQPFLESAFYVSDLVEPDLDAYRYRFVGDEGIGGRKVKLVEAVAKNPADQVYGKTVVAIDPDRLLILRRQFFDKDGKLVKTWTIDLVEEVEGVQTIRDQRMESVKDGSQARLKTAEIDYGVELADAMFKPEYLAR
jgi:hypothetical protein